MGKLNLYLFGLCVLFLIIKLISITATNFDLYGDEAQYWLWSKELSFGYYSKPPLLPWFIFLITFFFGDSFFVLKAIPVFLYCITSYLVFIFTKKLFKDLSLACCCALSFFLLPSVSLSSFLLSTDILLIFFWVCALIYVLNIKERPTYYNFFCLGFFLGLAFLAKYAAIYFIISLIFLVVIEKEFRLVFAQSKFKLLLSLIIALIILLPNMLWNSQFEWITLSHTIENASLNKTQVNFKGFFEFLVSQIIMIGPLLFFGFLFFSYKKIKLSTIDKFLISFALPALIIVLIESLLVRAHANWAAVSHVTLSIFFISFLYRLKRKFIYLNNLFNLLIGCVLFVMIGFSYPFNSFNRINGVNEFVQFLNEKNNNNIKNIVVNDRLLFASLGYAYRSNQVSLYTPHAAGDRITNHFQLKNSLPNNFSKDFILVGYKDSVNYLNKKKKISLLGSKYFPFSGSNIEIYEVIIE